MIVKRIFIGLCGLMMAVIGFAQPADLLLTDTVTITASRFRQPVAETGRSISVIYAKDLEQLPVTTLDELLRYVPGVEVQSRNGFGAQSDIIIRGSTFSQVLMLIDGMRLNDPLTGHFNSNIPVSPSEIERIEVLRGPAAAMYGPDAVGGVIHIITKTFTDKRNQRDELTAGVSYGEHNLFNIQAGGFVEKGNLKLGGGMLINTSDGQLLPTGLRNDFDIQTYSFSAGYRLNDQWRLQGRIAADRRLFNAQYFYTQSTFDLSREQTSNVWTQARVSRVGEQSQTSLDISFKTNRDSFLFNPAFTANIHRTNLFNTQLNHTHTFSEQFALNAGIQVDNRDIVSNDRGDHNDWHAGGYTTLLFQPQPSFLVTGSLRGDWDENYGFELLPQLQANYRIQKIRLRASGGKSIRAADYTERFISRNLPSLSSGRNLGNPDLEAERAWSGEVGLDFFSGSGIRLSGTVFSRWGTNLIDYILTNESEIPNTTILEAGGDYFFTQNISRATTSGFETEVNIDQKISDTWNLRLTSGYTFLNTTNDGDEVSKYLANHARHLLTTSAVIGNDQLTVSVNGLWKVRNAEIAPAIESELTSDYTVWNGKVEYAFLKGKLRANVLVHNLFNEQYADILGAKMPNRWILGGIELRIKG